MSYFALFITFVKFSLLSFGGGYVIIPLLYETLVNNFAVFSHLEFGNIISISQVLPGATSINMAIYTGYTQHGILGGAISALGFILPSLILTSCAVSLLKRYENTWFIQGFLKGARLSAFVMILYSIPLFFNMSVFSCAIPLEDIIHSITKRTLIVPNEFSFNISEFIVFIVCLILMKKGISTVKLLILSGTIGFGISLIKYCI